MKFIEKHFNVIVLCALLLILIQQCGVSRKADKAYKQAKATQESIDSLVKVGPLTKEEARHISEQVMFEFLLYEEDVDKGRTSLSDIKNKIEKK